MKYFYKKTLGKLIIIELVVDYIDQKEIFSASARSGMSSHQTVISISAVFQVPLKYRFFCNDRVFVVQELLSLGLSLNLKIYRYS
jgi:hypothetical protein